MAWILIVAGIIMFHANGNAVKTAYLNAKIFDGRDISKSDAFVVENDRFSQLGMTTTIKQAAGKTDTLIDLKGALVLPGFIESHGHLLGIGQSKMTLDLRHMAKLEIVAKVSEQAKKQQLGTWITGRGWDQNTWPDKQFPHKDLLKDIANPIYLRRVDGHAVWVNDTVLKKASINEKTKDPTGGQIIRDQSGKPTGVLIDNAIDLVSSLLDKPSRNDLESYFKLAQREVLSRGITSFHDAGASADAIRLFEDLSQKHQLSVRLNVMIDGQDQALVDNFFARGPLINDYLIVRSIKYFADGALGSRGASLIEPYHDQPNSTGLMLIDTKTLTKKAEDALAHGFQVATHAIGDQANRVVLDAYEAALSKSKRKDSRLRIEHAQLVDPKDHARFQKLSVIASMQPIHCTSDMAWVPDRLGAQRIKDRAYPWRSLLRSGAILAFGSDAPVEEVNPILGLYAAVTRSDHNGAPKDGFLPEQKLKLIEALQAFHHGGAYAEFNEHQKGKIAPGFFADFVVFDTDLLHPDKTSFLEAKPVMTVVGGKTVFEREKLAQSNMQE